MDFHNVSDDEAINKLVRRRYEQIIMMRALLGKEAAYAPIPITEAYPIEQHYMDYSTGTLREVVSLLISNADLIPGKHDFDGIRNGTFIECKPKLYTGNGKVDGSGSINDHSAIKHKRALNVDSLIQQSQFFHGLLGWIVEFPYKHPTFLKKMEEDLHKTAGRICGTFFYKHWSDCSDINVRYINKDIIYENKRNITGGRYKNPSSRYLYGWLMEQ